MGGIWVFLLVCFGLGFWGVSLLLFICLLLFSFVLLLFGDFLGERVGEACCGFFFFVWFFFVFFVFVLLFVVFCFFLGGGNVFL